MFSKPLHVLCQTLSSIFLQSSDSNGRGNVTSLWGTCACCLGTLLFVTTGAQGRGRECCRYWQRLEIGGTDYRAQGGWLAIHAVLFPPVSRWQNFRNCSEWVKLQGLFFFFLNHSQHAFLAGFCGARTASEANQSTL